MPNGYGIYDHGKSTTADQAVLAKLAPAHATNGNVLDRRSDPRRQALAKHKGVTLTGEHLVGELFVDESGADRDRDCRAGRPPAGRRCRVAPPPAEEVAMKRCALLLGVVVLCAGCGGGSKTPTYSSGAQILPAALVAPPFTLHDDMRARSEPQLEARALRDRHVPLHPLPGCLPDHRRQPEPGAEDGDCEEGRPHRARRERRSERRHCCGCPQIRCRARARLRRSTI